MRNYYFDMDGVLANFHKEPYKYANAISREWIANLEPFMNNVMVVKNLIAKGENVFILSKCAGENAKLGKLDWLKKYIPELDEAHIIILVKSGNKIDFVEGEAMMIDDDMKNIKPFIKAGLDYYFVEKKGQDIIF